MGGRGCIGGRSSEILSLEICISNYNLLKVSDKLPVTGNVCAGI